MKKSFIYSLVLAAVLAGCGDSAKEAASTAADHVKAATSSVTESTKEAAKSATASAADAVKEGKNVVAAAKEAATETASKAVEATKEAASNAVEATKEAAGKVVEKATAAATGAATAAKEAVAGADGAAIFKKCSACHGAKAEKKALGASQVIGGWDAAKIEAALHGYKAGTYGGPMKGVMKGQVASMSDADIKAVAEYISTLK
jgi:cytochrome c553